MTIIELMSENEPIIISDIIQESGYADNVTYVYKQYGTSPSCFIIVGTDHNYRFKSKL